MPEILPAPVRAVRTALYFVVFVAIGAGLGFVTWYDLHGYAMQRRASEVYVPVRATVLTASLFRSQAQGRTKRFWRPDISYRYVVHGRTRVAAVIAHYGGPRWRDEDEARRYMDRHFRVGQHVTAYVDPADPGQAVIWRELPPRGGTDAGFIGLWAVYGILAVVGSFRLRKRSGRGGGI